MQIRIVLTLSEEEMSKIRSAYVNYLAEGGEKNRNRWLKQIIMERIE